MSFDTASILRAAHAYARRRIAPSRSFRSGDVIDRSIGLYVPGFKYREALREGLQGAWSDAKAIARLDALATARAPVALTEAEATEISVLRYVASIEPLNSYGAANFKAAQARATAIVATASQRQAA